MAILPIVILAMANGNNNIQAVIICARNNRAFPPYYNNISRIASSCQSKNKRASTEDLIEC
jgi:hypothetical protein